MYIDNLNIGDFLNNNNNNLGAFSAGNISKESNRETTPSKNQEKKINEENKNRFVKRNMDEKLDNTNKLIIGFNNNKKSSTYIPEKSRYYNSIVIGNKATGKTSCVLPYFVRQDLENKDYGITVIATKQEIAYTLYALAKDIRKEKDIIFLKPSINNEISNKFLWCTEYNYDYINEFIINYKEAIKKKKIVIIDMEILKHKSEGLRAVAMLLLQLQLDLQETDITQRTPHFLYVDDAQYYLPFMEHLLNYSDCYNLGITLFVQSRNQFIKNNKDYTSIIDNNVRTTFLLNSLVKEDIDYYRERFYDIKSVSSFYNRNFNSFIYETLTVDNVRKCGISDFKCFTNDEMEDLINKAKKIRKKLLNIKRKEMEKEIIKSIKNRFTNNRFEELEEDGVFDTPEEKEISLISKEVIKEIPEDILLDIDFKTNGEPEPFDINLLDEDELKVDNDKNSCNDNLIIKKHINEKSKEKSVNELSELELKNAKKLKQEKIKDIILLKEKQIKRKVSANIFNKINSEIDYCDEDFDFSFD